MSIIVIQRPALAIGGVVAAAVNSYMNAGGRGERSGIITQTSTAPGMAASELLKMIDGVETENSASWAADFSSGSPVAGLYMKFQFTEDKNIDEITWYQSNSSNHGVWKFQGSTDDTVWNDLGSSFTLGGATTNVYDVSGDTNLYDYFRLLGVSGNSTSSPWLKAINFKIKSSSIVLGEPSYDNYPGNGDWDNWATLSTTLSMTGSVSDLFDGRYTTNDAFFTSGQSLKEIVVQTPEAMVYSEFIWYQDNTSSHGTWVVEGGSDGITYGDTLAAGFTLGGVATLTTALTVFPAGHTYIRLRQTAGTTSSSPYTRGARFKTIRASHYEAAADPDFASVSLLLGFEGTDGDTTTTDESSTAHAMTFNNGAQIDDAQSKFGLTSVVLDGVNDTVYAADHAEFNMGAGEFTVEGWFRWNTVQDSFNGLLGQWYAAVSARNWAFWWDTTGLLEFAYSTNGINIIRPATGSWTPTLGVWYHLAADRDSSDDWRVYADGAVIGTSNDTGTISTAGTPQMSVGHLHQARQLDGWVDEVRVTKGVARYGGAFTAPIAPFPRSA